MLKFKQQSGTQRQSRESSLSGLSKMDWDPCKASIIIKNISLPLAWSASEYFDHKGDLRDFNVCLSFKAVGGKLLRSRLYQKVNRTVTDLHFDEHFTFNDLNPDFTIEAMVSAKRVDSRANGSGTFSSVSRSFGKKFGSAFKKYKDQSHGNYTISAFTNADSVFRNVVDEMFPIAHCFFRLENAGLSGKIRVYSLRLVPAESIQPNFNKADLLPLFGTICCQVICRPECLKMTLVRSMMDIFYVDEELLLERLNCILEGGCVKCFTRGNGSDAGLILPIDQRTKVSPSAYQTSIRLTLIDESKTYSKQFMLILKNSSDTTNWISAIRQQICDAEAWGDFASTSTNPHALKAVVNPSNYLKLTNLSQSESMVSRNGRTMTNTDQIKEGLKDELFNAKRDGRRSIRDIFRETDEVKEFANRTKPPEVAMVSERREKTTSEQKKNQNEDRVASSVQKTLPNNAGNVQKSIVFPSKMESNMQKTIPSSSHVAGTSEKVSSITASNMQKSVPISRNITDTSQKTTYLTNSTSNVQKITSSSSNVGNSQKLEVIKSQNSESKKEQKIVQKVEPFRPVPPELKPRSSKTLSESVSSTPKDPSKTNVPKEQPKMKIVFESLDDLKSHEKPAAPPPKTPNSILKKAPKNTYVLKVKIEADSDDDSIDQTPNTRKKADSSFSDSTHSSLAENRPPENQTKTKKTRVFEQKTSHSTPQPRTPDFAPSRKPIFKPKNPQDFETEVTRL